MGTLPNDSTGLQGTQLIVDALRGEDIRHVVNLPDSWFVPLIRLLKDDPDFVDIPVAREEEGVAVCAGLELGGEKSAILMQNTGLLASVNAIAGLALKYSIPVLMLIAHRGAPGWRENSDYQLLGGELTLPMLKTLRVPEYEIHEPGQMWRIGEARTRATLGNQPVAVLLTQEAWS